jgi:hypothetical protein
MATPAAPASRLPPRPTPTVGALARWLLGRAARSRLLQQVEGGTWEPPSRIGDASAAIDAEETVHVTAPRWWQRRKAELAPREVFPALHMTRDGPPTTASRPRPAGPPIKGDGRGSSLRRGQPQNSGLPRSVDCVSRAVKPAASSSVARSAPDTGTEARASRRARTERAVGSANGSSMYGRKRRAVAPALPLGLWRRGQQRLAPTRQRRARERRWCPQPRAPTG